MAKSPELPKRVIFSQYAERALSAETGEEYDEWIGKLRDIAEEVEPEERIPAIEEAIKRARHTKALEAARKSIAEWKEEQAKYEKMGLPPRQPLMPFYPPEPISTSEIFIGMARDIEIEQKGYLFDFYVKEIQKAQRAIQDYVNLMQEKHGITREGYLDEIPPGVEREYREELTQRVKGLVEGLHEGRLYIFKPGAEDEILKFSKHLHPPKLKLKELPPERPKPTIFTHEEIMERRETLSPEEQAKLSETLELAESGRRMIENVWRAEREQAQP